MHIYIYVCMYVCGYIRPCMCIYIYVYNIYICIHAHVQYFSLCIFRYKCLSPEAWPHFPGGGPEIFKQHAVVGLLFMLSGSNVLVLCLSIFLINSGQSWVAARTSWSEFFLMQRYVCIIMTSINTLVVYYSRCVMAACIPAVAPSDSQLES